MRQFISSRNCAVAFALSAIVVNMQNDAAAQARGAARANVNRSANVNQNINRSAQVNQNVNVNRNINVDVDNHNNYHPFATAAVVTAGVAMTSAVIGSVAYSIPPSCAPVVVNGVTFQQCGSTWYQPQYAGTQVNYVVVNAPR